MAISPRHAHDEVMDAYELTHPILATTPPFVRGAPSRRAPSETRGLLVEARRYVHQLPLGRSPGPAFDRRRPSGPEAAAAIDRALRRTAAAYAVGASSDESPLALARRLVRSRAIVAPAADALLSLLPVLEADAGAGDEGVRLAERVIGYLDHRTARRSRKGLSSTWAATPRGGPRTT
jgi:hypothetical protein